jgi:hypothetical protein
LISERNAILAQRELGPHDRAALKRLEAQMIELPAGETPEDAKAMEVIRRAAAKLGRS